MEPCPGVAPKPGAKSLLMVLEEFNPSDCGQENLSWQKADFCARVHGGRFPTWAEWCCALGFWNDRLPMPLERLTSLIPETDSILDLNLLPPYPFGFKGLLGNWVEWVSDSSADGRHFLVGGNRPSASLLRHEILLLEEIRPQIQPQAAGLRLVKDSVLETAFPN